jgi:hypothetical protein
MKTGDKVLLGGAVVSALVGWLAYKGKLHLPKMPGGASSSSNASGVAPPAPRPAAAHTPTGSAWKPPAAGESGTSAPVPPSQVAQNAAAAGATSDTQASDWSDTAADPAAGASDGSQFTADVGS